MGYDVVVVGAGFAGSVIAERLATPAAKARPGLDRRPHIGGNAYDELDDAGILVHRYGPHIFHTNCTDVFEYLSRFTAWRPYEHRVLASVRRRLLPIPINRTTINGLYGLTLRTDDEVEAFYDEPAEQGAAAGRPKTSWCSGWVATCTNASSGATPASSGGSIRRDLDASVTARVPARTNTDDRYFTDRYQAMPADGYTVMFERMLGHPRIDVRTGVDFHDVRDTARLGSLVYTGPIDRYFEHRFGPLPYRSLRFEFETLPIERSSRSGP